MSDEYKEALASLRHYSKLRFAALAFFGVTNAALLTTTFSDKLPSYGVARGVRGIGILCAAIFLAIEYSLSSYIRIIFEFVSGDPAKHLYSVAQRAGRSRRILRYAYLALYTLILVFWICTLTVSHTTQELKPETPNKTLNRSDG